jgi:protein phosphatase
MSESDINLQGMGTTIVVCFCSEDTAHICHAGDSRAYLFRDHKLTQITEDHSAVALMVKQGYITREEAEDHPMKNRITRAIGTMREVEVDYDTCPLQKGDQVLLCTDGLSNMVREPELIKILGQTRSLKEKILTLIQMANSNGGHDNITAVLIEAT